MQIERWIALMEAEFFRVLNARPNWTSDEVTAEWFKAKAVAAEQAAKEPE